ARRQLGKAVASLVQQAVERERLPAQRAKLQQQRHALEIVLDLLDLLRRQVEQGPVLQRPQVHLVEQAIKERRLILDAGSQHVERLLHALTVLALDDDHNIVVVAELGQVFAPAAVVILVGTDEIVALRAVLEEGGEGGHGGGGQDQGDDQNRAWETADSADESGQKTGNERRPLCLTRFRFHGRPRASWPPCQRAADCRRVARTLQGEGELRLGWSD